MNTNTGAPLARSLDVLRVLEAARSTIERGWQQHGFRRGDRYCAYGAISAAYGVPTAQDSLAVHNALAIAILAEEEWAAECQKGGDAAFRVIADWNDEPGRTRAEVLAAFDKAIGIAQGNAPKAPTEEIP